MPSCCAFGCSNKVSAVTASSAVASCNLSKPTHESMLAVQHKKDSQLRLLACFWPWNTVAIIELGTTANCKLSAFFNCAFFVPAISRNARQGLTRSNCERQSHEHCYATDALPKVQPSWARPTRRRENCDPDDVKVTSILQQRQSTGKCTE